jgi:hypothetical protein
MGKKKPKPEEKKEEKPASELNDEDLVRKLFPPEVVQLVENSTWELDGLQAEIEGPIEVLGLSYNGRVWKRVTKKPGA